MVWTQKGAATSPRSNTTLTLPVTLPNPLNVGDLVVVADTRSTAADTIQQDTVADQLGNVYTLVGGTTLASAHSWGTNDQQGIVFFYSILTHAGTPTATVTYPSSTNAGDVLQAVAFGCDVPMALDRFVFTPNAATPGSSAGGTDSAQIPAILPATDGELLVSAFVDLSTTQAFTSGTGWAQDTVEVSLGEMMTQHLVQSTRASITPTGTVGACGYAGGVVAFRAADPPTLGMIQPIVRGRFA